MNFFPFLFVHTDSTPQKQRHSNQPTSRANVPLTDQSMAQYGFLQHPKPTVSHHDYNQSRAPTPSHGHSRKSLSWSGLSPNTRSNTSFSTWTENTRGGHTLYNDCPQSVPSPSTIYPSTTYPLPTIVYPPGTNVSVHTPTAGCVSYPGTCTCMHEFFNLEYQSTLTCTILLPHTHTHTYHV